MPFESPVRAATFVREFLVFVLTLVGWILQIEQKELSGRFNTTKREARPDVTEIAYLFAFRSALKRTEPCKCLEGKRFDHSTLPPSNFIRLSACKVAYTRRLSFHSQFGTAAQAEFSYQTRTRCSGARKSLSPD